MRGSRRATEIHSQLEEVSGTSDRFLDCTRLCIEKLSKDEQELIYAYYSRDANALAESLGISLVRLRLKVIQIRRALVDCYRRCLEEGKTV